MNKAVSDALGRLALLVAGSIGAIWVANAAVDIFVQGVAPVIVALQGVS